MTTSDIKARIPGSSKLPEPPDTMEALKSRNLKLEIKLKVIEEIPENSKKDYSADLSTLTIDPDKGTGADTGSLA